MQIKELIEILESSADISDMKYTSDTVKIGKTDRLIERVGVAMFPTVDVLRQALEWKTDFLIVHEPGYYDSDDWKCQTQDAVCLAKRKLLENSNLTVYRYHDHPHRQKLDMIAEGELKTLGLTGTVTRTELFGANMLTLDTPLTALEIAERMEKNIGIKHVRISGERNKKSSRILLCFGACGGGPLKLIRNDSVDIIIAGEAPAEWDTAEYVRDAAALGFNKSLITMGHAGSERDGMKLLAERLKEEYTQFETRYFECGEVFTYTDS